VYNITNILNLLPQEDVGIMKDQNMDSYRFSISWSRILPSTSNFDHWQFL